MRPSLLMVVGLVLLAAPAQAERARLVVLDLVGTGVEPGTAQALTRGVVAEIGRRGFFDVSTSEEVKVLLGIERQKQLLGCGSEGSCFAELAGALGAPFVLSGQLTKVGETLQLALQMTDASKGAAVGRSVRLARSAEELLETLPFAVAEATATPLPPQQSRALPAVVLGVGGAGVLAGAVVGYLALSSEAALKTELEVANGTSRLQGLGVYDDRAAQIGQQKTLALGLLIGGAVVAVGGAVWLALPSGSGGGAAPKVALVPTGNGMGLVGVWP